MEIERIKSELFREGMEASNQPPEKQEELKKDVEERLESVSEKEIRKRSIKGYYYETFKRELEERLEEIKGGIPIVIYQVNFVIGSFFSLLVLLLFLSEFWVMKWSLVPFGLEFEAFLIAASVTLTGMLAIHFLLVKIKELWPRSCKKWKIAIIIVSLVSLVISGLYLSHVRGLLIKAQQPSNDLNKQIKEAKELKEKTSLLPLAMGLVWLSMGLIAGVALHEALSRVVVSGNAIIKDMRIKRLNRKIKKIREEIEEWESLPRIGLNEFKRGINAGDNNNRNSWLSPLMIFITICISCFLFVNPVRAEKKSVSIMFDVSFSTRCTDYAGDVEFKKNLRAVPEIIKNLAPGTRLRIIGITDNSYSNPFLIINDTIPKDRGMLGETIARKKLYLIEKWNKLGLEPRAKGTDIFGSINLISMLMRRDKGEKELYILSDMRNTVGINLEFLPLVDEETFRKVEEIGLIPDLNGVRVWIMGVSVCGKSLGYWLSLEKFWRRFFERAGAEVMTFTMERHIDMGK